MNFRTFSTEVLFHSRIYKQISKQLSKLDRKFTADMTYGMLASNICLLTDIVDQLHEDSKKVNSVERLTRHLNKGIPQKAKKLYLSFVRAMVTKNPIIHIDDSDVIKPEGYKFEALGPVRDGSKSTDSKTVYEKGYHVTEACVLTVSFFIIINGLWLQNSEIEEKFTCHYITKHYFSRWRIEKYFRCKNKVFQFENFRIRKLTSGH